MSSPENDIKCRVPKVLFWDHYCFYLGLIRVGDSHFSHLCAQTLFELNHWLITGQPLEHITLWCKRYPYIDFQNIDEKMGGPNLRWFIVWAGHLNILLPSKVCVCIYKCWYTCMSVMPWCMKAHYMYMYMNMNVYVSSTRLLICFLFCHFTCFLYISF